MAPVVPVRPVHGAGGACAHRTSKQHNVFLSCSMNSSYCSSSSSSSSSSNLFSHMHSMCLPPGPSPLALAPLVKAQPWGAGV